MVAHPMDKPLLPLQLNAASANGRTVVHCSGKLITETASQFIAEAKRLAERSNILVLDLGGLTYMDSSGVGALVSVFTSLRRGRCEFLLSNVSPRVMQLLQLTDLEKVLRPTTENLL